jgi:hypothetical protein
MSRYLSCTAVLSIAVCLASALIVGCDRGAARVYAPKISSTAAKDAVEQYGADGKINKEQLAKCPSLAELANEQGVVTAESIQARLDMWKAGKLGRVVWDCAVTHNNKPLAGATVKFVPEKFLGPNFPTSVGKTNEQGVAYMAVPEQTPPGVPLGFYKVEITKEGENIPAKYNTETILGQFIKGGSIGIGATYNLKY